MKRTIVMAGVVLTALAFNGCNNEAAMKEAQGKFDKQLAQKDSLIGVAQTAATEAQTACTAQVTALSDSITKLNTALTEATTKKPAAAKPKPATTTPAKPKVTTR